MLDIVYADDEVKEIIDNDKIFKRNIFEDTLIDIEKSSRPLDVLFDETAVVNLTNVPIPNDILLVLSWGIKFFFSRILDRMAMPVFLLQVEHTMSLTINPARLNNTAMQIKKSILQQQKEYLPPHLSWLKLLKIRTERFFKQFDKLKAIPADKGKITVIMHINDYHKKLEEHLSDKKCYAKASMDHLSTLVKEEKEILAELSKNKK